MLGVFAGICPVAWGAFFADNSAPEDRGRIMGLSVALSMPISYSFMILRPSATVTSNIEFLIIGSILLVTLVTVLLRPQEKTEEIRKARRRGGAGMKQIVFYAVPVFLFYIVV